MTEYDYDPRDDERLAAAWELEQLREREHKLVTEAARAKTTGWIMADRVVGTIVSGTYTVGFVAGVGLVGNYLRYLSGGADAMFWAVVSLVVLAVVGGMGLFLRWAILDPIRIHIGGKTIGAQAMEEHVYHFVMTVVVSGVVLYVSADWDVPGWIAKVMEKLW